MEMTFRNGFLIGFAIAATISVFALAFTQTPSTIHYSPSTTSK
jgi:hypothetical protein